MNKMQNILDIYARWAEHITGTEVAIRWCADWGAYPQDWTEYEIEIGLLMAETDINELPIYMIDNFDSMFAFEEFPYTLLYSCMKSATL